MIPEYVVTGPQLCCVGYHGAVVFPAVHAVQSAADAAATAAAAERAASATPLQRLMPDRADCMSVVKNP